MTKAETELLIQLSKDTNTKLTELSARFNGHVQDDNTRFQRLWYLVGTLFGGMSALIGWLSLR